MQLVVVGLHVGLHSGTETLQPFVRAHTGVARSSLKAVKYLVSLLIHKKKSGDWWCTIVCYYINFDFVIHIKR